MSESTVRGGMSMTQLTTPTHVLTTWGRLTVLSLMSFWLFLFAGGIMIDTQQSRAVISPAGVEALDGIALDSAKVLADSALGRTTNGTDSASAEEILLSQLAREENQRQQYLVAWIVTILFFLPTNLAAMCLVSGTLGAFGAHVNLDNNENHNGEGTDSINPYVSGALRGFFVYLVLVSGLLLLTENPFQAATPSQYVRLAGFLSLTSFIVSYRPEFFGRLVEYARRATSERVEGNSETQAGGSSSPNGTGGPDIPEQERSGGSSGSATSPADHSAPHEDGVLSDVDLGRPKSGS